MVWAVYVEIAGQRQADSFFITAGDVDNPREVTLGRPPAKADTRPDIVVPEKSVSKVHAVLRVSTESDDGDPTSRLIIADRSRFGTIINGKKIKLGGSQELIAGDVVQLAPRTFVIVEELPLVLAVHPGHPELADVREAAARAGARLTHVYDSSSTTHVLYGAGDVAWSALVVGALHGASFAGLDWLRAIASAGLLTNSLPSPPHLCELLLGPARPPARVPLPPPPPLRHGGCSGLLEGFTFGYGASWQDGGLAPLLTELGGRVVDRPQGSPEGGSGGGGGGVVVLVEGGGARGGPGCLSAGELLTAVLTLDAAEVRQLLVAACGAAAGSPPGRQTAAAAAAAVQEAEPSQGPADSDVTQAAEEEEEDGVAEVSTRASPREAVKRCAGAGSAGQGGQVPPSRLLPATVPNPSLDARATGLPAASAREGAMQQQQELDGWLVAARHPEDANPASASGAATDSTELPPGGVASPHEDAPLPKRRRLASGAAAGPSGDRAGSATALPTSTTTTPAPGPASRAASPAPTPALLSCPEPTKHEPVAEAPWMSQQPHGRSNGGRRSGAGLRSSAQPPAAAAVAVKEEPAAAAAPLPAVKVKGKAGKGKAAASSKDELGPLGLTSRAVQEEVPGPEVLDASAQVVLEADLFAATPEQQLLPPSCRSGSAEPPIASSSGGGGGGGGGDGEEGLEAAADLRDFKQFRKQGAQLPRVVVRPLPVFMVDNFERTEEVEAYLRKEEERISRKRQADDMFKKADVGSKKPPRAPRRG